MPNSTARHAKFKNAPDLAMSRILMLPAVNTMALVGFETGSMNANWLAIAPGRDKYSG